MATTKATTAKTQAKPGGKKVTGKIFISYRREDSATIAGRLHDWLVQRMPKDNLFFDLDSIQYGVDFEHRIQQLIPQCKAVLAIIGPRWLDAEGRPSPHVIMELELARNSGIQIIPVLVEGASMPPDEHLPESLQRFRKLNAAQVRSGRDFQHDMEDLAKALGIRSRAGAGFGGLPARVWGTAVSVLVVLALLVGVLSQAPEGNPLWQVVHARVLADVSLLQGAAGTAGWDEDGSTCVFEPDGYHVIHNAFCGAPPYGVDHLSTYTISVSAREIDPDLANFYGLTFRSSTAGGYQFLISGDGSVVVRGGQPPQNLGGPPGPSSLINTGLGAVNRLEVRITGSHFALVINGSVIGQLDDATLSSGSVGFSSFNTNRVRNPSQGVTDAERQTGEVVFTDFKITAPLFGA